MKGSLSNIVRVRHILDAIEEIEQYIDGVSEEEFLKNSEKKFATIKQVEIIGEACNKISDEIKNTHSDIAWHQIIGFRHISIHEYHNVSFNIVWGIATKDIPVLKRQIQLILTELQAQ